GIGRRMPWTMTAFAIGALSMIGLPPAAGFISKWYMVSGAMAQEHWVALAVILVSTLLNAGYFLPIIYRAFFRPLSAEAAAHPHGEAPLAIVIALTFTAAGTLALFFFPDVPLALAQQLVEAR
ncbi:MAG: proton-conducting transporter membrane subunit, partial [Burkholderiaceae bacterium]|nr:proton-conducting transporter membrane subunit [Burkholderiaceae bacterium]